VQYDFMLGHCAFLSVTAGAEGAAAADVAPADVAPLAEDEDDEDEDDEPEPQVLGHISAIIPL